MNIFRFLFYPYPFYENSKQALKICTGIGLFISLFCYLFRPVGLDELNDLSLLGFGLVTFIGCSFYMVLLPLLFPKVLTTNNWKIYKEILWIILINVSNSLLFYYYLGYVFNAGYEFKLDIYLFVLTWTVIIAVIPAIAIIFYKQIFVYKKIVKVVEKIDAKLVTKNNSFIPKEFTELNFSSENKNESLTIDAADFLFLSSAGNYVEVFYIKDNLVERKLLRNNLSRVEKEIGKVKGIIRCHRSHIVNTNKIHHVKGNLQGYRLYFRGIEEQIPVSRSYTKLIKENILSN
jgi:hypothetical protein